MATIKERIEKIKPYFRGMQVQTVDDSNIIYVAVSFPPKWIIDKELEEKFNISIARNDDGNYYFCAEMEVGFDTLFDAIECNINKMVTAQERAKLLKDKIFELQEIFLDETIPIERLRNYEFVYKPKKKTGKKTEVKEEDNVDEMKDE